MKWNCPACDASYTVDDNALGKTARCKKCGTSSVIRDDVTDEPPPAAASAFLAAIADDDAPCEKGVASANAPGVSLVGVVLSFLILMLVIAAIVAMVSFSDEELQPARWLFVAAFLGLLIQFVTVLPFYLACDDIRRIRKVVENQ